MDHNEHDELDHKITGIIRRNIANRTLRIKVIFSLIETYLHSAGKLPASSQLERLADYLLQEELKDPNPYKIAHNDQPFLSAWQYDLRQRRETSLKIAEEIGSDGYRHAAPKRRKLSRKEMIFLDEQAKSRNAARALQYAKDTAPGPVITYYLRDTGGLMSDSFLSCTIRKKRIE